MKKIQLGKSDLQVSDVCLGTMTWGRQNTEADAFEQLDYVLKESPVNFMDTAEMYAVPPSRETSGLTETYIGNWFARNPEQRDKVVLASKVAGPGVSWIRDGAPINRASITQAIEESLQRLQTDYIDLYQLHWPNRVSPHFSKHWPRAVNLSSIDVEAERAAFLEILQTLGEAVEAGKIRYCGLSNETPWGIGEYINLAREHDLPSIVSVQNEFSLLHLKDWPYTLEYCALNEIAYLPWSPLAGGALSGKYANGAFPEGCRWTMQQRNGIFRDTENVHRSVARLSDVAERHGLILSQMCLAWVYQTQGVTSTIIGATSMSQLRENLEAYTLTLSEQVLAEIDAVIRDYPLPF